MHLDRLEKAGLVTGQLELSADGKAMKYFELVPFELVPFEMRITAETVIRALGEDDGKDALHMESGQWHTPQRWPRPAPATRRSAVPGT
jgi:hypothetical protein